MAGVRVISTSTIQAPSHGDSTQKLHLTPWDLESLPIKMNQKGLLFRNPINTKDTPTQIQHLKQSLSTTLAHFPSLAGRLVITTHEEENTASYHILCNNAGALFVHAVAENTRVADILQPKYVPPVVSSFFALNGVRNYEGTSQPLLAVQVTELVDGVFIGVTISHVAADGESLWLFINSWSEISRGCRKLSKPPALERWFPDGIEPPIPIPFPFIKDEERPSQVSNTQLPSHARVFHFTKEKIRQLKAKANAEANTDKISSLQALLTHLWLSVIRCQRVDPKEEVIYFLAIGARRRMVPPLPENYFGNALQMGVVSMRAGELLEGGLGKGAWEMNKAVASHSDENLRSDYESRARTPILLHLGGMLGSKALGTSSSPRFNVYGNDFGWGKPVAASGGGLNKNKGVNVVFSGAEEGSVDIEVCLPLEILEAMGNDPEFMDAITI